MLTVRRDVSHCCFVLVAYPAAHPATATARWNIPGLMINDWWLSVNVMVLAKFCESMSVSSAARIYGPNCGTKNGQQKHDTNGKKCCSLRIHVCSVDWYDDKSLQWNSLAVVFCCNKSHSPIDVAARKKVKLCDRITARCVEAGSCILDMVYGHWIYTMNDMQQMIYSDDSDKTM